tara:strand:+ start:965 stop:1183 length:219 start_codon:yes stop_codon:yes gene_type:complete
MKTLLLNAGFLEVEKFSLKILLTSLLFKLIMITGIGFLTFVITSANYSQLTEVDNEVHYSQKANNHPPTPFS